MCVFMTIAIVYSTWLLDNLPYICDCYIRVYYCTGIIYCFSCKDTEQLSEDLRANGIKSACYHANLTPEARTQAHSQWLHNTIQVQLMLMFNLIMAASVAPNALNHLKLLLSRKLMYVCYQGH